MENGTLDIPNDAEENHPDDEAALVVEQTSSCWDERTWADNIVKHDFVQASKSKLERRIAEFLSQADSVERADFEIGRTKLLKTMLAAEKEYSKKYPETNSELIQTRSQAAKAKIKDGCKAFSATVYEYSQIMDVLTNQAPEYVALTYGALKIVLVVQINHEELKQKVRQHMELIRSRFEIIDHLTAYMPRRNLVRSVAKVYELFSRFLAKAIKYYSMTRFKATWRAFSKPWKIYLQALVDEIDQTFVTIKDMAQYHGLLEGHINLIVGQRNLINSQKTMAMQVQSLARLAKLENMMEQVQATFIRFSKEQDVQQTASLLRQRVDESFQDPEKRTGPVMTERDDQAGSGINNTESETGQVVSHSEPQDLIMLRDEMFPELRDYHLDLSRRERMTEQAPEMRGHRSKLRNMLKIDKVMDWVQSDSSQLLWIDANGVLHRSEFNIFFAAPILLIGESNYESTLILRHFCDEHESFNICNLLIQALLYQIFEQHPHIFGRKKASITRECTSDISALWDLFLDCLNEVNADCTFIIIDSIDALRTRASNDAIEEGNLLMQKLNTLVKDEKRLIKILLTASLTKDQTTFSDSQAVLMLLPRKSGLAKGQDEMALVPHKMNEIYERRCKTVSFAEIRMLYSPNTTIYTFADEEIRAFVVTEVSGGEPLSLESYSPLQIRAWSVDHNGSHLARHYHNLRLSQFSGQRAVVDLRYVPAGYLPKESERRLDLITRGKRWWAYSDGIHHVRIISENAEGIVDHRTRGSKNPQIEDFQEQISAASGSVLKPLYLMLCPPTIDVFMLQELRWVTKNTLALEDVSFVSEDVFDSLPLSDLQREYLLSLGDTQMKGRRPDKAEMLNSGTRKDPGTSILLRVSAGIGETLTAEAFAAHVKKPLLSLGSGELGDSAKDAGASIRKFFHLAQTWDCILLIRNIDTILPPKAQSGVLQMNPLTDVFLDALDNFTGILFMTSNSATVYHRLIKRVTTDLHLGYLSTESALKILKRLIEESEMKGIRCNEAEILDFGKGKYEKQPAEWKSTGRNIRNVFNMAIDLAKREARTTGSSEVKLGAYHLELVEKISDG